MRRRLMNDERIWEQLWLISRYYPSICLEELRKTMENLSQGTWSPGQDLGPE
jgi:hypothetical protein